LCRHLHAEFTETWRPRSSHSEEHHELVVALAGIALSGLQSALARGGLVGLLLNLTLFSVFAAGYLKTALLLRFALAVLLVLLGLVAVFSSPGTKAGARNRAVMVAIAVFVLAATVLSVSGVSAGELDKLFRYVIVLPAAFVAGVQIVNSSFLPLWVSSYRFWTAFFSLAAVSEFVLGRLFFPREGFIVSLGSLSFRSLVLSEHSLVLATMLLAGVPYLFAVRSKVWRLTLIGLVGIAIGTTGSDGPLALFALVVVLAGLSSTRPFDITKFAGPLKALVVASFVALITVGAVLSQNRTVIVTSTTDEASAQYRLALYATIWPSLLERPGGFGLAGIPDGVLLIATARRILDLARSIDSEYVMLALEFGWFGVILSVVVMALVFGKTGLSSPLGISTILISAAGFFLAIHVWLGLGALWFIQLGMLVAQRRHPKGADAADQLSRALTNYRVPQR
jgi:hypothetical protein